MLLTILVWYLWACAGIFSLGVLVGLVDDIRSMLTHGPDFKFGYNVIGNPFTSMWMFIVVFVSCPIINILAIGWWIWTGF